MHSKEEKQLHENDVFQSLKSVPGRRFSQIFP